MNKALKAALINLIKTIFDAKTLKGCLSNTKLPTTYAFQYCNIVGTNHGQLVLTVFTVTVILSKALALAVYLSKALVGAVCL